MSQLPTKITKKEEEKLIRLGKEFCEKIYKSMDISSVFDTTVFNDFNKYINNTYYLNGSFEIPEFTKQIDKIGESLKNISYNFQIPPINFPVLPEGKIDEIRRLSEELDGDIDTLEEELSKKDIDSLREETNKKFNILREELKKDIYALKNETKKVKEKSIMGVEVTETGNFYYKDKKLCIGTNSNAGKFFKYLLEDKNHFVPDSFCINELKSEQIKNIRRDLNNKYLKKDGLKAIINRSGNGNGYILTRIVELKSL